MPFKMLHRTVDGIELDGGIHEELEGRVEISSTLMDSVE